MVYLDVFPGLYYRPVFCMLQVRTSELCAYYSLPDIIQYFIIYVFIAC